MEELLAIVAATTSQDFVRVELALAHRLTIRGARDLARRPRAQYAPGVKTAIARGVDDPTVYPAEDHMGETEWHRAVCLLLWVLARRWAAQRKLRVHVGSNQFVYWAQHEPTRSLAPDLYVIPGLEVGPEGLDVVKTWEHGVPSLVVEIASIDWRKDYEDAPRRCDEMGVRELIVFDAKAPRARQPERVRWQLFRRVGRRGLVRVEATNDDRIRSRVLGAWLREVGKGGAQRVRIATGTKGDTLVPTDEEVLDAVAAERDAERAARAQAEAEIERLRAQLGRRRR